MAAYSKQRDLERISLELLKLTLHREQLSNRLRLLGLLEELRQNAGQHGQVDEPTEDERQEIEEELKKLSERKLELQALQEKLESTLSAQKHNPLNNEIFVVEPPPYPAPRVISDLDDLPRHPSHVQCPYCEQFITTEVSTVIGNAAWLMCLVSVFTGCIAGCCLVPFCIGTFKDVMHKCPKCRSHIHTCTKM